MDYTECRGKNNYFYSSALLKLITLFYVNTSIFIINNLYLMHYYQKYSEKELIGRGNFGKTNKT